MIFWYLQLAQTRTSLRKCAFSVQHCWRRMSSITTFMLNGLILCLTTQNTTWKKALLYISMYKQTNLANLLSCLLNAAVCMAFFKVITSTVTCKCSILTFRQRMT